MIYLRDVKQIIAILFILSWAGWPCTAFSDQQSIKIVVNHAPPYRIITKIGEDTTYSGIYIDFIRLALEKLEMPYEFQAVPFSRALRMMEKGQADMMLGPNKSPEREAFMNYLEASFPREDKVFYAYSTDMTIQGYEDLYQRRVYILNNAKYFDRFDQDEKIQKIPVNQYEQALLLITNRDHEAVIVMPETQGDYLLQYGRYRLEKSPFKAVGKVSYVAISRKSFMMGQSEKLEKVLRHLQDEGIYDQLKQNYTDHLN